MLTDYKNDIVDLSGLSQIWRPEGIIDNFELAKPLKRYNSYYLLWKELRKQFGHQTANEIIELQLTGAIYINDFTDVALPYCFNYSTYDIYCNGLVGISKRMHISPPKSFDKIKVSNKIKLNPIGRRIWRWLNDYINEIVLSI